MEQSASFLKRFYQYQKERFPFLSYLLVIGMFSFSAIAYSIILRGENTFVSLDKYLLAVFNAVIIFFLLRIFDEFKDEEDDRKHRSYLPVPRGLIRLSELQKVALFSFVLQIILTAFFYPKMLMLIALVYAYMLLMRKEFFVKDWLKKNQFWYVTSHMMIIPLVDVMASGFDWHIAGLNAPLGMLVFFVVSFFNGLVLEIGRKIKAPEDEEPGVLSYTFQVGTKKAIYLWVLMLSITAGLSIYAVHYVNHPSYIYFIIWIVFVLALIPAFAFLNKPHKKWAKGVEIAASVWTLVMYLSLGGIPMLIQIFS